VRADLTSGSIFEFEAAIKFAPNTPVAAVKDRSTKFCSARTEGRRTFVLEAAYTAQVKALFLAVLTARHRDWYRGEGACRDFRWRPKRTN